MIFVSRQDEIEQLREIRERSQKVAQFTVLTGRRRIGKTLKEIGEFTRIDAWWDRKGENEIDMITVDDISRNITFYEIKRQSSDINLYQLESKVDRFLTVNAEYADYYRSIVGLSMEDM